MTTYTTSYKKAVQSSNTETTGLARPLDWLRRGWGDVTAAPTISLLLGVSFTLLCAAAYIAVSAQPFFSASVLALLLLISPFLAATAYSVVQQREQMRLPSLRDALGHVRSRALSIGLFSIVCTLIVGAWVRLSSIAFALYYGTLGEGAAELARIWTTGFDFPAMLVFMTLAGAVLGLTLFAIGAVALPLIVARNHNFITAIHYSWRTLRNNTATMLVWMLMIIALVTVSLLTGLALMPIVFPVLAYATWHSYREFYGE